LFYGLKRNHPHNVGLIHLLCFVLRRVFFALAIVFMAREGAQVIFGIFLLLLSSLVMLALLLTDAQWEETLIVHQHTFNEIALYILLCTLMSFCGFIKDP